jgi:branched-chain amino acid transport system ATP-binding protein
MGLVRATSGSIRFDGAEISRRSTHVIANQGVAYLPEDRGIFATLTVLENLRLTARRTAAFPERLEAALQLFPDLKPTLHRGAGTLSGGQKQMLAIARALMNENRLVLVDEPSKALAPVIVAKLAQALLELKQRTAILLVEQNFKLASQVGDRYVIIDGGRTVLRGEMADLVRDQESQRRYLGVGGREAVSGL